MEDQTFSRSSGSVLDPDDLDGVDFVRLIEKTEKSIKEKLSNLTMSGLNDSLDEGMHSPEPSQSQQIISQVSDIPSSSSGTSQSGQVTMAPSEPESNMVTSAHDVKNSNGRKSDETMAETYQYSLPASKIKELVVSCIEENKNDNEINSVPVSNVKSLDIGKATYREVTGSQIGMSGDTSNDQSSKLKDCQTDNMTESSSGIAECLRLIGLPSGDAQIPLAVSSDAAGKNTVSMDTSTVGTLSDETSCPTSRTYSEPVLSTDSMAKSTSVLHTESLAVTASNIAPSTISGSASGPDTVRDAPAETAEESASEGNDPASNTEPSGERNVQVPCDGTAAESTSGDNDPASNNKPEGEGIVPVLSDETAERSGFEVNDPASNTEPSNERIVPASSDGTAEMSGFEGNNPVSNNESEEGLVSGSSGQTGENITEGSKDNNPSSNNEPDSERIAPTSDEIGDNETSSKSAENKGGDSEERDIEVDEEKDMQEDKAISELSYTAELVEDSPANSDNNDGDEDNNPEHCSLDVNDSADEVTEGTMESECMFEEGSFVITDVRSLSDSQTDDSNTGDGMSAVDKDINESNNVDSPEAEIHNQAGTSATNCTLPITKKQIVTVTMDELTGLKRPALVTNEGTVKKQKTSQEDNNMSRTIMHPQQQVDFTNSAPVLRDISATQNKNTASVPGIFAIKREPLDDTDESEQSETTQSDGIATATTQSTGVDSAGKHTAGMSTGPIRILQGKKIVQGKCVDTYKTLVMKKVTPPSAPAVHSSAVRVNDGITTLPQPMELVMASGQQAGVHTVSLNQGKASQNVAKIASKRLKSVNNGDVDTVGIVKITELISRKNPIPVYKPLPVPQLIKNDVNTKNYTCYECGDTYSHYSSYKIHVNRCSMKITYSCDKCSKTLAFTNKCQLLGHLRSHLNIALNHAVPIHIKTDSIKIKSVFEDLMTCKFEWYKDVDKTHGPKNKRISESLVGIDEVQCRYCKEKFFDVAMREEHFSKCKARDKDEQPFVCSKCPLLMSTRCALSAHNDLHRLIEVSIQQKEQSLSHLSVVEPNIPQICPECGKVFHYRPVFFAHLFKHCAHFSKRVSFTCTKCSLEIGNYVDIEKHLAGKLEQYYKCDMCPMAFKQVHTFMHHFATKHDANVQKGAKIIYRCHICNTLIDDRQFLMSHMAKHKLEIKKNIKYKYHCLQCAQLFPGRKEFVEHNHHGNYSLRRKCQLCYTVCDNQYVFAAHVLQNHTCNKYSTYMEFCKYCGLVCSSRRALTNHVCLAGGPIKVIGDGKLPIKSTSVDKSCGTFSGKMENKCSYCKSSNFASPAELKSHEILCAALEKQKNEGANWDQPGKQNPKKKPLPKIAPKKLAASNEEASFGRVELKPKQVSHIVEEEHVVHFQCDKCDQTFTRKSKQELHMKEEHGLHACLLCGLIYESQSNLKRHLTLDHEGKKLVYFCFICRKRKIMKSFLEKSSLERHLEKKHRMKSVDSSKLVPELPGLEHEERGASGQGKRKAVERGKLEPVKRLKVEGETTFNCAKCLFTCDSKQEFLEHIPQHKVGNSVQCIECGLCFIVVNSLKKHLFIVHKVRDFDTYMKENDFGQVEADAPPAETERELASQVVSSDDEPENLLACKVCFKEFETEVAKNRHMRVHGMAFIRRSTRQSGRKKSAQSQENSSTTDEQSVKSDREASRETSLEKEAAVTKPTDEKEDMINGSEAKEAGTAGPDVSPSADNDIGLSSQNGNADVALAETSTTDAEAK